MKPRLLIVDDDESIRTQLKWALTKDYEILLAEDRIGALETFKSTRPAVTVLDLGLSPRPNAPDEGLRALAGLLDLDGAAKVIIISGQGDKENAVRAVGAGAFDFFASPSIWKSCDFYSGDASTCRSWRANIARGSRAFRSKSSRRWLGVASKCTTCSSRFARSRRVAPQFF